MTTLYAAAIISALPALGMVALLAFERRRFLRQREEILDAADARGVATSIAGGAILGGAVSRRNPFSIFATVASP